MERLQLFWGNVKHTLTSWVAGLSTLVGLTGGVAALAPVFSSSKSTHELVQSAALAFIALAALAWLVARECTYSRRIRFAATVSLQQGASERIRDLSTFLSLCIQNQIRDPSHLHRARAMLEEILDDYAAIFSMITTTRCRVCVKLVAEHGGVPYVFALARDRLSGYENKKDDKERQERLLDKLEDNTDFLSLFDPNSPDLGYFFSDDLTRHDDYKSSSFNYWQNVKGSPNVPAKTTWLLPYKSAIVYPIRQEERADLGITKERCVGFLAVDSASRRAFKRRWDVPVGKAFANNLYPALERYSELDQLLASGERDDEAKECGGAQIASNVLSARHQAAATRQ